MKSFFGLVSLVAIYAFTPAFSVSQFKWLEGNWEIQGKDVHENWHVVNDTLLSAVSFHHDNNGKEVVDETIQLVYTGGNFYYIPTVPGQNSGEAVAFKIVSQTSTSFVAENPQHDFPQRIVYQLTDAQHLLAYIEGMDNGKQHRYDFYFTRTK